MIDFEFIHPPQFRGVAVVGDTFGSCIGKPASNNAALTFDVSTQPSGSDIFSAGTGVAYGTAIVTTFTNSGWHTFTATGVNGEKIQFDVVAFPANALTVDQIKYASLADKNVSAPQAETTQRRILRALALASVKASAQAALEGGAATAATGYGTRPSALGAAHSDNYQPFGGW